MKILHVTESLGGGVATALAAFARNSCRHQHYLFASVRPSAAVQLDLDELFSDITYIEEGWIKGISRLYRHINTINPDFIHLHSSYGGAFGRLLPFSRKKVIYTPHCFAFEREDLAWPLRFCIWVIEWLLSTRSSTLAAISPREAELGKKMLFERICYVPNSFLSPCAPEPQSVNHGGISISSNFRIACVGRLCPQKDPYFFGKVAKLVRAKTSNVDFLWIGDGEPVLRRALEADGVQVSGWLPHARTIALLKSSHIYAHVARWEGAPISLIEAASLRMPIIARDIPALRSLGTPNLMKTPSEFCQAILDFVSNKDKVTQATIETDNFIAQFAPKHQRAALELLYMK